MIIGRDVGRLHLFLAGHARLSRKQEVYLERRETKEKKKVLISKMASSEPVKLQRCHRSGVEKNKNLAFTFCDK